MEKEKMDVREEIKKVEDRLTEAMNKLREDLPSYKKKADEFVKEEPYMALGLVFFAGLGLGILLTLAASAKG